MAWSTAGKAEDSRRGGGTEDEDDAYVRPVRSIVASEEEDRRDLRWARDALEEEDDEVSAAAVESASVGPVRSTGASVCWVGNIVLTMSSTSGGVRLKTVADEDEEVDEAGMASPWTRLWMASKRLAESGGGRLIKTVADEDEEVDEAGMASPWRRRSLSMASKRLTASSGHGKRLSSSVNCESTRSIPSLILLSFAIASSESPAADDDELLPCAWGTSRAGRFRIVVEEVADEAAVDELLPCACWGGLGIVVEEVADEADEDELLSCACRRGTTCGGRIVDEEDLVSREGKWTTFEWTELTLCILLSSISEGTYSASPNISSVRSVSAVSPVGHSLPSPNSSSYVSAGVTSGCSCMNRW